MAALQGVVSNVSDSKEDIDLETSGGGIEAKHCSGQIHLNTSGGSLELYRFKWEHTGIPPAAEMLKLRK